MVTRQTLSCICIVFFPMPIVLHNEFPMTENKHTVIDHIHGANWS